VTEAAPTSALVPTTYAKGDRIYRWVLVGQRDSQDLTDIQPLTVVRANRTTLTVRTDEGNAFRLPHAHVAGRVDWEVADA
jgi:hypothetical protein